MNDNIEAGVTDLLHRAAEDFHPPVSQLLERAAERGRRTRRRHLAVTVVATSFAIAGIGAITPALSHLVPGTHAGRADVASDLPAGRRHIAVPDDDLAQTLSALLPGNDPRTHLTNERNAIDGVLSGSLTWHGARITIGIDDAPDLIVDNPGGSDSNGPSPSPRPAPKSPAAWCRSMAADQCHALPNGDWMSSSDAAEPGDPANFQTNYALYTSDGYLVFGQAAGLTRPVGGRALSSPLTLAQLQAIVESDVWLTR